MEETNQQEVANENQEVGNEIHGQESGESIESKLRELESKNARLLAESQKYKTRYDEVSNLKKQLEDFKKEKVERDGSLEEKVKYYQEKFNEVVNENKNLKVTKLYSELEKKFSQIAPDCVKPQFVINNEEYANDIKAALDYDNLTVDEEVLKSIYQKDKETNKFLYQGKKLPSFANGTATPDTTNKAPKTFKGKKIDELTPSEFREFALKQLEQRS